MMLHTREHEEIMRQFERDFRCNQPAKEPKHLWKTGYVYANGDLNRQFIAYRMGYAFGKTQA